jgi:hypothetical protein
LIPIIEVERNKFTMRHLRTYGASDTGPNNGTGWTIKAAIMAATAAPTMFPAYTYDSRLYVDAAFLRFNNPAEISYLEMKRLTPHCKEALFLDIGTGNRERAFMPSDFHRRQCLGTLWRDVRSQFTCTEVPSQNVGKACNGDRISETTYHRLDVKFPRNREPFKSHQFKKLDELEDYVADALRMKSELNEKTKEVATRIANMITRKYSESATQVLGDARLRDPCNLVAIHDTRPGVCFLKYSPVCRVINCENHGISLEYAGGRD